MSPANINSHGALAKDPKDNEFEAHCISEQDQNSLSSATHETIYGTERFEVQRIKFATVRVDVSGCVRVNAEQGFLWGRTRG